MNIQFKNIAFLLFLFITSTALAQAPQAIPYQAVARNSSGAILVSTAVSVRFSIRDSVANGSIKYRESHIVTTTDQGMFSVNLGQGTPISGTFAGIKWGTNAKFLQVEIDPTGGSSYTDMGTQQMMSVPYAINAASIKHTVSVTGDTLYSGGGNFVIIPGISAANLHVGMSYGGGIIAYIFQPGDTGYIAGQTHGLIAASSDQSTGIQWGGYGTSVVSTSTNLGSGAANTSSISASCGTGTAARLCSDLVLGGYSDWYLPSISELNKLYINKNIIEGFDSGTYWSSSQYSSTYSWLVYFENGLNNDSNKTNNIKVRAVRSF